MPKWSPAHYKSIFCTCFCKEKMAHPEGLSIASQDSHHLYGILCLNLPISLHHTLSNTTEPILKMHCAKWYHAFTVRCNNTLLGICNSKQKGSSSWETAVKKTVKDSCGSCSSFKSLWIATSCITSSCIVGKYNIGSKFYFGGFNPDCQTAKFNSPSKFPAIWYHVSFKESTPSTTQDWFLLVVRLCRVRTTLYVVMKWIKSIGLDASYHTLCIYWSLV